MSKELLEGKKKYASFMNSKKEKGMTHAEALSLWREQKGRTQKKPRGIQVSTEKPKRRKKKRAPKQSGFTRPKKVWDKLHTKTNRSRVNLDTIKRIH